MENDTIHIGLRLLVSLAIGFVIGIERTIAKRGSEHRVGARDFMLVSIFSFAASLMTDKPYVWALAFGIVLLYSLMISVFENMKEVSGLTTVITLPITFILASLINFGVNFWFIATLLFVVILVLGMKEQLHAFSDDFQLFEILDLAILIAITITITPLVPSNLFLPVPLFNYNGGAWSVTFQNISVATFWKVVVMVSIMSFGAHFITKYIKGRNALLLATFFGGLVSSLATIILLLSKDPEGGKEELAPREIFLGFVAANTGSITKDIAVFFLVIGAAAFEKYLFPMVSTLLLFVGFTTYSFARAQPGEIKITKRPLPLSFVVKFSFVFACVMVFMAMVTHYLGSGATVLAAFFSGVISSAAALAAVGNSLASGSISVNVAGWSTIAALLGSLTAKYLVIAKMIGWQKSSRFAMPIAALAGVGLTTMWMSLSMASK
ncbi:MgtC/SapB family protein [Candidatus Magnetaquicoccus inordinatus]|uniref:MgtC/SapB family protein n=1 Tax=Candidatus Magnetaquicoccus inordinatus TaxID=2496818 RepID=UPI00102C11AC|nr:MgtC/SapB family protein [Candidatus Magnetaquicoccus inordinatus]